MVNLMEALLVSVGAMKDNDRSVPVLINDITLLAHCSMLRTAYANNLMTKNYIVT